MNIFDEMPTDLKEYLTEQMEASVHLTFTYSEDSIVILLRPYNMERYICCIEWYDGSEDWSTVNITGHVWTMLEKMMKEETS